jgi:hypothetical protein
MKITKNKIQCARMRRINAKIEAARAAAAEASQSLWCAEKENNFSAAAEASQLLWCAEKNIQNLSRAKARL